MPGLLGGFGNNQNSFSFLLSLYTAFFHKLKFKLPCSNLKFSSSQEARKTHNNFIYKLNDNIKPNIKYNYANFSSQKDYSELFKINLLRSKFGPYLAGLIEGDGTIAVHEPNRSAATQKYNPKIIIVFKKADLPLANYLQNITKCGKVLIKPERGYVLWQIQDIISVYTLIYIINGFMRTPKIEALNKAIVWLNDYKINARNIDKLLENGNPRINLIINKISLLEIKPLDQSPLETNAWLAGFTDGDGNFSINIQKRTNKNSTRVQLYYRLEINKNYHKLDLNGNTLSFFPIISKIGLFLGVTVYSRSRIIKDKIYYSFTVMSFNKSSNSIVYNYFNKYPLLSSKFLDFKDWAFILKLQNTNKLTTSYLDKAIQIRYDFNKTRTTFVWDHLKFNCYETCFSE